MIFPANPGIRPTGHHAPPAEESIERIVSRRTFRREDPAMTRLCFRTLPLLLAAACVHSADAEPPKTEPGKEPKADIPAPAIEAPKTDPTAGVVAEGRQIYRQRDVDALVLIAERHRKAKLSSADEQQLRQALARILVAREPLLEALDALPPSLASGKAHDALVLDLLDYQAEGHKPADPAKADATKPDATKPDAAKPAAPEGTDAGPVIVSLPPLIQVRNVDKLGKRQLSLQISLFFPDAATARKFEPRAPIIRDAILGCIQGLGDSEFADPSQNKLKQALLNAITAKLPDFPKDGVLIPQLDAGAAEAKDKDDK
jgi:flagellar basal body-associated protein FliL